MPNPNALVDHISNLSPSAETLIPREAQPPQFVTVNFQGGRSGRLDMTVRRSVWLSTDLRVFQMNEGESRFGVTLGSTSADASSFIKQVITNLNTGSGALVLAIALLLGATALQLVSVLVGTVVLVAITSAAWRK